jgi:hypothetical protein
VNCSSSNKWVLARIPCAAFFDMQCSSRPTSRIRVHARTLRQRTRLECTRETQDESVCAAAECTLPRLKFSSFSIVSVAPKFPTGQTRHAGSACHRSTHTVPRAISWLACVQLTTSCLTTRCMGTPPSSPGRLPRQEPWRMCSSSHGPYWRVTLDH